jgi:ribosomal protein L37AE/L43A
MNDITDPPIGKEEWLRRQGEEYNAYLRSERWYKIRLARKVMAMGKCEMCAHLTYKRFYREELSDLLWVCSHCHQALDGKGPRATSGPGGPVPFDAPPPQPPLRAAEATD